MSTLFCLACIDVDRHVLALKLRSLDGCRLNLRVVGSRELCSSGQQRFASPTISVPASTASKAPSQEKKVQACPSSQQTQKRAQAPTLKKLNDSSEKDRKNQLSANLPLCTFNYTAFAL
jgi:hypothetical protein